MQRCRHLTPLNIAILAGVVNFLPYPNPPRTRGSGVRDSQMMRRLLYKPNQNPAGDIFVQAEKTVRPARLDEIP